jgi:nucleoside-diphosphate-sugar epimerase
MNETKKLLITGSSGYLGNFLAVHFANQGHKVVGLDIAAHPVVKDTPNFTFYKCDVRDKAKMLGIFQKEKPTHVIHLAYLMDPHHDAKFEYEVDVKGSQHTLECANETGSVIQFILFSSASIYGADKDNPVWFHEDFPLEPRDYTYAIHKKTIEGWYRAFQKRTEMKLVIMRMCTAVGPSYYKKGGVVSSLAGAPFMLQLGPRRNAVQFIHEEDVNALVEKIVNDSKVEDTFNLGPDSFVYSDKIAKALNKKVLPLPLFIMKTAFWLMWKLRLAAYTPAMAKLVAFPIAAHPKKIMEKYNYEFKYTTLEALMDAIEQRGKNGTL